jgi:hypothetical protein
VGGSARLSKTATAGTKRVGHLLRALKWSVLPSERFLLEEANTEVERLKAEGKRLLGLCEGWVLAKPQSRTLQASGPGLGEQSQTLEPLAQGMAL